MTTLSIGNVGYLGVAEESTYGTAETSGFSGLFLTEGTSITKMNEYIHNNSAIGSRYLRKGNYGRRKASGTIEFIAERTSVALALKFLLEYYNHTSLTSPTRYPHYFSEAYHNSTPSEVNMGAPFTIRYARGLGNEEIFTGCVATSLTIKKDEGANYVMGMLDFTAQDASQGTGRTSITLPTSAIALFTALESTATNAITVGGTAVNCKSFEFKITIPYDTERFYVGQSRIERPNMNGLPMVEVTLGGVDSTSTLLNVAYNTDPRLTLSSHVIELAIGDNAGTGTDYNEGYLNLRIPNANYLEDQNPPHTNEKIVQDLKFQAVDIGSFTRKPSGLAGNVPNAGIIEAVVYNAEDNL